MPTLCKLIGYKPEQELNWDGQDIWPILLGNSKTPNLASYIPRDLEVDPLPCVKENETYPPWLWRKR